MADQMVYEAFTTVKDSTGRSSTVTVRVSSTNGKAYVAAADDAARLATSVGTLLAAFEVLFLGGDSAVFERGVRTRAVNDGFSPVDPDAEVYNSNKINIHYSSVVSGITRGFLLTIPQRDPADYTVSTDGVTIVQGLSDGIDDLVTALSAVGESIYGTSISAVMTLDVNDQ